MKYVRRYTLDCQVDMHSSQFQSLCSTKSSSEMLQNLPYFIYLYENPLSCFFRFSFRATLYFYLMNSLVYVNIDIRKKYKVARNETRKNQLWVFVCLRYGKFWSISLELFIEHKPSNSEKWWCNGLKSNLNMTSWKRSVRVISNLDCR